MCVGALNILSQSNYQWSSVGSIVGWLFTEAERPIELCLKFVLYWINACVFHQGLEMII